MCIPESSVSSFLAALVLVPWWASAAALEEPPAAEPDRVEADLNLGVDLIGLWGGALRVGYHGHHGWLDMVGLRLGYAAGPAPLFGDERIMAALFVAPTIDLFPDQEWQLELTLGPAALDRDERGDATVGVEEWGWIASVAGRYKTEGAFQINLGPMVITDFRARRRVVIVDIGPSWVW